VLTRGRLSPARRSGASCSSATASARSTITRSCRSTSAASICSSVEVGPRRRLSMSASLPHDERPKRAIREVVAPDCAIDQTGVRGRQRLVAQAPVFRGAGLEVPDQHVGPSSQLGHQDSPREWPNSTVKPRFELLHER